ncbi:SHOCT domain-containing protein [Natrinema pallidum]|uniref:SHOCT domain-containing protein n=1 Tax=Natrinema pallidum TaxID=69527 RepID=A0A4P9TBW2_9EURY|nr:SHOCT domain-containing protein [Natrinema pallidum]QCW02143.1 SHOCT domain-containing protein [Natrinema pallidum]
MDAIEGTSSDRTGEQLLTRFREHASGIASLLVTAIWLGAMVTGQDWWLAALLVGYIAVVPIVGMLFDEKPEDEPERTAPETDEMERNPEPTPTDSDTAARDALETLRERYAAGELTDAQFERKLERLLDTETLADARARARDQRRPDRPVDRERERNREREFDR